MYDENKHIFTINYLLYRWYKFLETSLLQTFLEMEEVFWKFN